MEILFLGTSAGWPLPRLGCNCEICSSTDPKDIRLRPSLLINKQILIDAGPDIYQQIKKFNLDPREITHILITHGHEDHFIGLYDLSHIYDLKDKIKLLATQRVLSEMRRLVGISMRAFRIQEIKPFEKINLGKDSSASFIPVEHGNTEAYAIKIKAPKPIFYALEFRKILPSARKELGNCDLAIIDGSSKTSYGQARGHETIEEGIRLGREIQAKKILFTNIGHKTDRHVNISAFVKEKGGDKFGISFDGLEVKL